LQVNIPVGKQFFPAGRLVPQIEQVRVLLPVGGCGVPASWHSDEQ
jgi:hypothetical protein